MRPSRFGLILALGLGLFVPTAKAQESGFSDPFFLYYGFYLPRQAALAAQRQPEDSIRAYSAQRQYTAQTDAAGLYEPLAPIGSDELDPLRPFGVRTGSTRMTRTSIAGLPAGNIGGRGVAGRHNSVGSYYPTLRTGPAGARRGPRTTSVVPQTQGMGMGMGMGMGAGIR